MPDDVRGWLLIGAVLAWAGTQYGLAFWALRDLARRPRVRGGNKVLWALVILVVPIIGALVYATIGPTSFLPRAGRPGPAPSDGRTNDSRPRPRPRPPARRRGTG